MHELQVAYSTGEDATEVRLITACRMIKQHRNELGRRNRAWGAVHKFGQ